MKRIAPVLLLLSFIFVLPSSLTDYSQTRERVVGIRSPADIVKVDVDLVVLDALVIQQKTGRVVGNLKRDDFVLTEDGIKQQISFFGQDALPLSVILLVDRGGCLDPFGSKVRQATMDAVSRLKPTDEVALMGYHNQVKLVQGFTRDRSAIADGLDRMPPHDEEANHCLNRALSEAANYMMRASNPSFRRVVTVITGVTSNFDCDGVSGKSARHALAESGAVVCGLIPRTAVQQAESGTFKMATSVGGLFKVPVTNLKQVAEESGGEVLDDKPETLDHAFNTLMDHLRTRYNMGFVSTNRKRDGSVRKLKVDVLPQAQQSSGKLVVKAKRSYIAPK
jgi:VWFA-related protein